MAAVPGTPARQRSLGFALALLAGFAVALSIGLYARLHEPALRPLFLVGFSGMLQLKAWLATAAVVLVLAQLTTALWLWGHLPGAGRAPDWLPTLHRWSGSVAFVATVPVALHCVWSLGFATTTPRVLVHSLAGCAFYGAYAAKMLSLRVRGLPRWALPVLGGTVFTLFLVVWTTSAVWFFTRSGVPLR
jgi:hypothetical protein